jgi:pSer/pThr/pTyr-binding forkhead associated (FHA) protein
MALILELRDARGRVTRQRLDGHALSLGRGLGNDVILEDPYVDARHAHIARDETGAWSITDLGSVNGLFANGTRVDAAIPVQVGTEVRIGRTLLRFRDTEEAVAPALVEEQEPSVRTSPIMPEIAAAPAASERAPTTARSLVAAVLETTRGRLAVLGLMLGAFGVNTWLGDTTRSPAGSVFAILVTLFGLASLWAIAWAAATRRVDRRFHFLGHLAVVSAGLLGALVAAEITEWLTFLFPGTPLVYLLTAAAYLALVAALVAGHLGVSGTLPPRRRWRAGAMVAGAIVALVILATLAKDDTFSDTPKMASSLKPLSADWIPAGGVDDFGGAIRKVKREADDDVKEDHSP